MENYRAMAIFVQVVDCGSFSAAAGKLGITKSAVSQQVSQLEETLGTRLLQRTTRQLSLTEAGDLYLEGCRLMMEAADQANRKVGQYSKEPSGTLRISCSHDFAADHLVTMLGPFMEQYPKLSLEIDGSDDVINLVEEQVDLAIRLGHLNKSGWIARKIGALQEVLVASPAYLKQHGMPQSPSELADHLWVAFTRKSHPYQLQLQEPTGEQYRIRLYGRASSNSAPSVREMVKAGMGIGQSLRLSVIKELESEQLVQVLPDFRSEPIGIYVVYPQRAFLPVIDFLVANKEALGVEK